MLNIWSKIQDDITTRAVVLKQLEDLFDCTFSSTTQPEFHVLSHQPPTTTSTTTTTTTTSTTTTPTAASKNRYVAPCTLVDTVELLKSKPQPSYPPIPAILSRQPPAQSIDLTKASPLRLPPPPPFPEEIPIVLEPSPIPGSTLEAPPQQKVPPGSEEILPQSLAVENSPPEELPSVAGPIESSPPLTEGHLPSNQVLQVTEELSTPPPQEDFLEPSQESSQILATPIDSQEELPTPTTIISPVGLSIQQHQSTEQVVGM
jgi:hypothetical protein